MGTVGRRWPPCKDYCGRWSRNRTGCTRRPQDQRQQRQCDTGKYHTFRSRQCDCELKSAEKSGQQHRQLWCAGKLYRDREKSSRAAEYSEDRYKSRTEGSHWPGKNAESRWLYSSILQSTFWYDRKCGESICRNRTKCRSSPDTDQCSGRSSQKSEICSSRYEKRPDTADERKRCRISSKRYRTENSTEECVRSGWSA